MGQVIAKLPAVGHVGDENLPQVEIGEMEQRLHDEQPGGIKSGGVARTEFVVRADDAPHAKLQHDIAEQRPRKIETKRSRQNVLRFAAAFFVSLFSFFIHSVEIFFAENADIFGVNLACRFQPYFSGNHTINGGNSQYVRSDVQHVLKKC